MTAHATGIPTGRSTSPRPALRRGDRLTTTARCLTAALIAVLGLALALPAVATAQSNGGDRGRSPTPSADREGWGASPEWEREDFFEKNVFEGKQRGRSSLEKARGASESRGASEKSGRNGSAEAAPTKGRRAGRPNQGGPPKHAGRPQHAGPPPHAGPPSHAGAPNHAGAPSHAGARGPTTGRPSAGGGAWPWVKWKKNRARPRFAYWQTIRIDVPGRRHRRPLRVRTVYHYRIPWANRYRAHVDIRIDAVELYEGRRFLGVVDRIPGPLSRIRAVVDRDYGVRFDRELLVVGASDLGFEMIATRPVDGLVHRLDFDPRSTRVGHIDLYRGRVRPVRRSRLLRRVAYRDLTPVSIVPREADWLYRTDRWNAPGGWGRSWSEERYDDGYGGWSDRYDDRYEDRFDDRDDDRYERRYEQRERDREWREERDDRRDDRLDRFERDREERDDQDRERGDRERGDRERGDRERDGRERDGRERFDGEWFDEDRLDRKRDGRNRDGRNAPDREVLDRERRSPIFTRRDTADLDGERVQVERTARVERLDGRGSGKLEPGN